MSENNQDDRLLRIEQSIIDKIEHKTENLDKIEEKIEKKVGKSLSDVAKKLDKSSYRKKSNLSPKQEYELKKHKIMVELKSHLTVFASVNGFLFILWLITSGFGSFPWFIIPAAGWGIGLISHIMSTKQNIKKLDILYPEEVRSGSLSGTAPSGQIESATNSPLHEIEGFSEDELDKMGEPYGSYIKETNELAHSLKKQINQSENVDKKLINEINNSLKHYTGKVYYLAKRGQFLESAIKYFENNTPEKNKETIETALKNENLGEETKKEYENAMRMLEKQSQSLEKLMKVKETINARLQTSLITLRTLQLDFLRLQYITDESAEDAIHSLNQKTEEIDEYIDLLSDSLKDIDNEI